MSVLQGAGHIKNTVALIFWHIQCSFDVFFGSIVSTGIQVQPQIILHPDYLPDYISVSYDYV